jgi:hypothetical protein
MGTFTSPSHASGGMLAGDTLLGNPAHLTTPITHLHPLDAVSRDWSTDLDQRGTLGQGRQNWLIGPGIRAQVEPFAVGVCDPDRWPVRHRESWCQRYSPSKLSSPSLSCPNNGRGKASDPRATVFHDPVLCFQLEIARYRVTTVGLDLNASLRQASREYWHELGLIL